MKKVALALIVALSLGGCASLQSFGTAVSVVTKSIANPVTRTDLDAAEAGIQVVFTGLMTYRKACLQGIADVHCRDNIKAIQVYTRQVPVLLKNVRAFVDQNDQINGASVYNALMQLINDAKNEAFIRGVKLS